MAEEPVGVPGGADADDAVEAVRAGDTVALDNVLTARPDLATSLVPGHGGRTLLHVATDWPGHLPHVAETIAILIRRGADVDATFVGEHEETPLHWAASSDDLAALDALLDAGAAIDARGAVVSGGTPLNDATAFGQWRAARRLVERGAVVSAWDAAALGLTGRLAAILRAEPDADLGPLLWAAAHGGQRDTVVHLLDVGADPSWVGWDGLTSGRGGAIGRLGRGRLARAPGSSAGHRARVARGRCGHDGTRARRAPAPGAKPTRR